MQINSKNHFFMRFLKYHFAIVSALLFITSIVYLIETIFPLSLIVTLFYLLTLTIYLFLKSFYNNNTQRIHLYYFIPVSLFMFLDWINYSFLIQNNPLPINKFHANLFGFSQKNILENEIVIIPFIVIMLYIEVIILKQAILIYRLYKQNRIEPQMLNFCRLFVVPILITISLVQISLILVLFGKDYSIFSLLARVVGISTYLLLILNPKLLNGLKNQFEFGELNMELIQNFNKINGYLKETKPFLQKNYSILNISVDTGITQNDIRDSIKQKLDITTPLYINSYKINYACDLIQNKFLDKYTIGALAEKSGFNSQVNFNRVFKKIKSVTPSEYKNSIE